MADHLQQVKKSVSFVFIKNKKGELQPNGTGFFVGVKNEENEEVFNVYFVTAKHVLQDSKGVYFPQIYLRINDHKNNSKVIELSTNKIKIFEHEDAAVDIALFNCLPDQSTYDFKFIPNQLLADRDTISKHDISEGDEVFFAGLFTSHVGQKRNQPLLRFGRVSLMPEDKIEWKEAGKEAKLMDLYLLECQSFGGNSGAPVFFQLNPLRTPGKIHMGGPQIYLAGIMTGSFLHGNKVQITDTVKNLVSVQNIGIAAVTPAHKLYEILYSKELIEARMGK